MFLQVKISTKLPTTFLKPVSKQVSDFSANLIVSVNNYVAFPNSGNYLERADLRGLPLEGYIIFYRVLDDGIEILRVVSGRRNLPFLFESE